jgi:hypothetical protein
LTKLQQLAYDAQLASALPTGRPAREVLLVADGRSTESTTGRTSDGANTPACMDSPPW